MLAVNAASMKFFGSFRAFRCSKRILPLPVLLNRYQSKKNFHFFAILNLNLRVRYYIIIAYENTFLSCFLPALKFPRNGQIKYHFFAVFFSSAAFDRQPTERLSLAEYETRKNGFSLST